MGDTSGREGLALAGFSQAKVPACLLSPYSIMHTFLTYGLLHAIPSMVSTTGRISYLVPLAHAFLYLLLHVPFLTWHRSHLLSLLVHPFTSHPSDNPAPHIVKHLHLVLH